MDWQFDASNVFTAMHHRVTGELLHLMDGLYSNIEDGLFELAFRAASDQQKRRCFDLMRDMRFQRSRVIQTFAKRTQSACDVWLKPSTKRVTRAGSAAQHAQAQRIAARCTAHFGGVLQTLAERAGHGLDREVDRAELPISPYRIACHFIESMKSLQFDDHAIEIVENLFERFVLERMGTIYGECNRHLEHAGFLTAAEAAQFAAANAKARA